jgi:signal transduction histidine kinase
MDSVNVFETYYGVLRDIIRGLHPLKDLEGVLSFVVKGMTEALEAKGALVQLFDPSSQQHGLRASWGMDESNFCNNEETCKTLKRLSSVHEKVLFTRDILNAPEFVSAQQAWDDGVRLIMELPIAVDTQMLGVMRIFMTENREFSNEELDFILTISEQFACVIGRLKCVKAMEDQYDHLAKHTEKMSSLGRMAAGIAHEINNPLAGILLYSSNMINKVPDLSPLKEGLDIIISETTRCKGIIQGLLEFARDREPQKVVTNINLIVKKSLQILKNEFHIRHIIVESELGGSMLVFLDENQIEQVLVNILLNAIQAIDNNGTISIKTGANTKENELKIEITDSGCGIAKEQIDKIFDPFFSTKSKGTGLGLAVSYGIINSHEGNIKVDSRSGQGTRFTITLPLLTSSGNESKRQVSR